MTIELKKDAIKNETIRNIVKEDDQYVGLCFIGTVTSLTPSGKIYAPWTTNQTQEDVDKDQQFWEDLDQKITETMGRGYFVHFHEDNVYIARLIDMDTEDIANARFDDDYRDFLDDFDLEEFEEHEIEDYLDKQLNDNYPPYKICGTIVLPAEILKTDKGAYRQAFNDLINAEFKDIGGAWCKPK